MTSHPDARTRWVWAGSVVIAVGALVVGCSTASPAPTPTVTKTTHKPSPEPTNTTQGPIAPKYAIQDGSSLQIAGNGNLNATSGTLTVSNVNGATKLIAAAQAADGSSTWSVNLSVAANGRVIDGTVTFGKEVWQVVPTTGLLGTVVSPQTIEVQTARAFTINQGTIQTNRPVVLTIHGRAD